MLCAPKQNLQQKIILDGGVFKSSPFEIGRNKYKGLPLVPRESDLLVWYGKTKINEIRIAKEETKLSLSAGNVSVHTIL